MKKLFWVAFLLPALGVAQSAAEKHVLDLHHRKFQWLIEKDYDSLQTVLHPRIAYIHSNGWVEDGREVMEDLKSGKLHYGAVSVTEASAKQVNNCVIVTGRGQFTGLMQGKEFSIALLYTEVYVKVKKRWWLLQRHANRLP
ncbi:MAG: nuclear transport factor 2 family protein [Cyclobacteriaceae bacterium]|nr:nuclear transport factor 2 family protein [Cyclobacteriaceae bacterium]